MECKVDGYTVILDDDFDIDLSKLKVSKSNVKPYVRINLNGTYKYLHRMLTECPKNKQVDHINGNSLDNRKLNLRIVSHRENMCNQIFLKKRKYPRGVFKKKDKKNLKAQISVNSKTIHLGYFACPIEAHVAYLKARKKYYPEGFGVI